tara:strand:+ start:97 stop:234 length:138 start_codon:yes stop_codon:yes gene_type:complete
MNITSIIIVTFISSVSIYLIFLVIGIGGIETNRTAQGFDKKSRKR